MQTKNQKFADKVFDRVIIISNEQQENLNQPKDDKAKKYKSLCKRAGGLLRNSGLVQFLAFLKAKAKADSADHHRRLITHLQEELIELDIIKPLPEDNDLYGYSRKISLPRYMYLTREVLNLLNWHKRHVDTLIEGNLDNADEE